MRSTVFFIALILCGLAANSQGPQMFKYQAVARDGSGNVLANKPVAFRISILQGSFSGPAVYSELHSKSTNSFGLVDFEIGNGNSPTGNFTNINWGATNYFIKTEMDPAGGTAYQLMGTSQLLSVPYALYARDVQNKDDADADPNNEIQVLNLSGNSLSLNKGGGSVTIPGDNWGTQGVVANSAFTGNGTVTSPLGIANNGITVAKLPAGASADKYLRGDGTWAIPVSGITTETDPVWAGENNETGSIWRSGNVGIGTLNPAASLHVRNSANLRQIVATDWADMSSSTGGWGLFSSNAYLNNWENTFNFSNTHPDLGATGIVFNSPHWHSASIFVNTPPPNGGSVKDKAFTPNMIATFKLGEVDVHNNKVTNLSNPVSAQDAATKAYVDAFFTQLIKAGVFITDIEGNNYPTVKIGTQVWMAENLKTTKYNDGTAIQNVTDNSAWSALTSGAYCWFNNDINNKSNYGALYNWFAVNTGKLCPKGWHVPTEAEWTTLITLLGGWDVAGGKMKSVTGWLYANTGTTNESGFSGLPGGNRNDNGSFLNLGYWGSWWYSGEVTPTMAWSLVLDSDTDYSYKNPDIKQSGSCIRCVKDY